MTLRSSKTFAFTLVVACLLVLSTAETASAYYSPSLGRFISRDPLEYVDGPGLYRAYFVPNAIDPYGLCGKGQYWIEFSRGNDDTDPGQGGNYQTSTICVEFTPQSVYMDCAYVDSAPCFCTCKAAGTLTYTATMSNGPHSNYSGAGDVWMGNQWYLYNSWRNWSNLSLGSVTPGQRGAGDHLGGSIGIMPTDGTGGAATVGIYHDEHYIGDHIEQTITVSFDADVDISKSQPCSLSSIDIGLNQRVKDGKRVGDLLRPIAFGPGIGFTGPPQPPHPPRPPKRKSGFE